MQYLNERPLPPKEKLTLRLFKAVVVATGLLASASYASALDLAGICCDGGYEYRHKNRFDAEKALADLRSQLAALERERQRLAGELAAAQKQNATQSSRVNDLEQQLADRDREIASLRSGAGDSARLASQLSSTQGNLDQSKARAADLERQLAALQTSQAALQTSAGDKDRMAAELAALQAGAGDKDKLAADLAAANQRATALESQVAGLQAASGDNAKPAAELAAAKQRIAEIEGQLADGRRRQRQG